MQPTSDRIFIKEPTDTQSERTTESGLVVLEDTKRVTKHTEGKVHAVGPKVLDVKVGDQVIFSGHAYKEVEHENQKYLMLRESDIMAIRE